MELILNDLSLNNPAPDTYSGRELMNQFILLCKSAIEYGAERSLRTTESFYNTQIAPDYSISNWLTDSEVDLEYRRYLRSLAHKAPYIDTIDKDIYNLHLSSDFNIDGQRVTGLGAAYLLDGLSISLKSENRWLVSRIHLNMEYLDEELNEIINEEIHINHASQTNHLEEHQEWFQTQKLNRIIDGKDLWARKHTLFPQLIFCESVREQVWDFHHGNPMFRQTIKRLSELNTFFTEWTGGAIDLSSFPTKITPESKETLKRFNSEHTFQLPNGEYKLFSLHARMTPGAWRLFFAPDDDESKGIIGYIGPKLPNVTYPT
jgi:hypothetical protein